jgi:hypothetical protein
MIWLGPKQQAALNHFAGRALLKVLLGPPSSGKSTILRQFQQAAENAVVLPISGPQHSAAGVLATLLRAAQLGPWDLSEVEQRNLLTVFVQQRSLQGKRVFVCLDNVSAVSPPAWEEIERLRLLQFANRPIVELAMVGTEADAARPPLDALLHESTTSAIEAVHFLASPTDHDIAGYIDWRLSQYESPNHFSEDACRLINCLTQGRYSFINILCQLILMEHQREPGATIDAGMVKRAAASLASLKDNVPKSDTLELKQIREDGQPADTPPGRLVVSCNGTVVSEIVLNGRLLIGRSKDNDLYLPSRFLSRHHAAILPTPDGHYYIVDLNSANGVLVNGKLVSRGVLYDRDVVGLGPFRLKMTLGDALAHDGASADLDAEAPDDTDRIPMPIYAEPPVRIVKR